MEVACLGHFGTLCEGWRDGWSKEAKTRQISSPSGSGSFAHRGGRPRPGSLLPLLPVLCHANMLAWCSRNPNAPVVTSFSLTGVSCQSNVICQDFLKGRREMGGIRLGLICSQKLVCHFNDLHTDTWFSSDAVVMLGFCTVKRDKTSNLLPSRC